MSEYVIINKTTIQKRIEELENDIQYYKANFHNAALHEVAKVKLELEQILSQSTPLIPEIEKAYENGFGYYSELLWDIEKGYGDKKTVRGLNKQDYILNLKLNI